MSRRQLIFSLILFIILIAFWTRYYFVKKPPVPEVTRIEVAPSVTLFNKVFPLVYNTIAYTGDTSPDNNGEIFAALKDINGAFIRDEKGEVKVCHNGAGPDFTSLYERWGHFYAITQLECQSGGAYRTRLKRYSDGALLPTSYEWINLADIGGIANNCAGVVTPWGSHLGGEEYEADMRKADATNAIIASAHRYHDETTSPKKVQQRGYNHGWMTEIKPYKKGFKVYKHYAMGRFSHELGFVMPDQRTVYLSDDGSNSAFFMFVADEMQELSGGRLYAARWEQQEGKSAKISWIDLGHTTDEAVHRAIRKGITFADLFDRKKYKEGCREGFTAVKTAKNKKECLRVRPGMELLASRLESRRYAALLGATTEFNKGEGLTYDAKNNRLYFALSVVAKGMEDFKKRGEAKKKYDLKEANHIRLPYNPCGMIASLQLQKDPKIGSEYVATKIAPLLEGTPKEVGNNICDPTQVANPDNISMLPDSPYMVIAEDSKAHERDILWIYDTRDQSLQKIATAPYGAEFTSAYWHRDLEGYSYLVTVVQHPYGEADTLVDHTADDVPAEAKRSIVGYFGPFKF